MDEKRPDKPLGGPAPSLTATVRTAPAASGRGPRYLLILQEGHYITQPLPRSGEVILGRSERCSVRIQDPSISRQHALLRIGSELTVEDLGSSNGTIVRDEVIEARRPVTISTNESFLLGKVTAVVQQRSGPMRSRRLWSHDYFEGRVAEECARAERGGPSFTVLRVRFEREVTPQRVRESFAEVLREVDVLGLYGPSEYEVLLIDTRAEQAEPVIALLRESFTRRKLPAEVGAASFPGDGRDADKLIARARDSSRAVPSPEPEERPVVLREESMRNLYRLAERVAGSDINVLILGETGVGKQVLAEYLHESSPRASRPLLELNCSALSENLLESELFGHEKGAFTGAVQSKPGLLETAHGGTVFLDEIGDMALPLQAKLLRVLENQEVLRVGGLKPRKIDVRFVAATNRDLEQEVQAGTFRQDLYYRVSGVTLQVPPLRDRLSEIEELARAFLEEFSRRAGGRILTLSDQARELLRGYSWPGNIRELRNVIERATLLCSGGEVTAEHLPVDKMRATFATPVQTSEATPPDPALFSGQGENPALAEFSAGDKTGPVTLPREETRDDKKTRILEALMQTGGNVTEAAKILGISRRTLGKWMEIHGIPRPRKRGKR